MEENKTQVREYIYKSRNYRINRKPRPDKIEINIKGNSSIFSFCRGDILHGTILGKYTSYSIKGERLKLNEGE